MEHLLDAESELLSSTYPRDELEKLLIPKADWHPYPTCAERHAWEALPASVRKGYLAEGKAVAAKAWPQLLAVRYMDFARSGNRSRYAAGYFERRRRIVALLIAECIEAQGRFLDEIVNGVWLICEESSWCVPAHIRRQLAGPGLPDTQEPTVDLFAAETAAMLAWVSYLLESSLDGISPLVRPRIQREVKTRVLTPCLERDDFSWMGFHQQRVNNWNPWINSNWLTSALLLEADDQRRIDGVAKAMRSLDRFTGPYPTDGGCDEGPGYWGRAGASLLDCLELLHSATDGQLSIYDQPLIQEIGRFIYRVQIADDYFVNFADASALITPSPFVVFRYGQRIGDPKMMALGAWSAVRQDVRCDRTGKATVARLESLTRLLPTLFNIDALYSVPPTPPLPRDTWMDQIQVVVARDQEGAKTGFCVAAKGGHNAESHNHNDVGNVVVYRDGEPVLIDAGVETYTRRTFSAQRYEIWTMQSAYHSLPTVNGVMQAPGEEFAARDAAFSTGDASAQFSLDIAGAYPPEAGIKSWKRTVILQRGAGVTITDTYDLTDATEDLTLSLLTPCKVDTSVAGKVMLSSAPLPDGRRSGSAELCYEDNKLTVAVEEIPIDDPRIGHVWGDRLYRILFQTKAPSQQGTWTLTIS
jgi:hypothetical protein